jgi:hypothetical protein
MIPAVGGTGETEVLRENPPHFHFVHHLSSMTWPGIELDRCCGKPESNRLSYFAASVLHWVHLDVFLSCFLQLYGLYVWCIPEPSNLGFYLFSQFLMTDIFVVFLVPSKRLPESYLKTCIPSFHRILNSTLAIKTRLKYDEVSESNKLVVGMYALTVARTWQTTICFSGENGICFCLPFVQLVLND